MTRFKSLAFVVILSAGSFTHASETAQRHNVIIFVADGLRWGSVTEQDTPALWRVRTEGVHFKNSHSLFPTFTTPNASAIATGHYLGDTGDFGNSLMTKQPVRTVDKEGKTNITQAPFIEDDLTLRCIDEQFPGSHFLDEDALLAIARSKHFLTAAIGKLGPIAIQDIDQALTAGATDTSTAATVIIDDNTGHDAPDPANPGKFIHLGIPLPPAIFDALKASPLGTRCWDRHQPSSGTSDDNHAQQDYMIGALTQVVLPYFQKQNSPEIPGFVVVYWSRDPDGTQHNHGDNLGRLDPGINGGTCHKGVLNANANLQRILDYVDHKNLWSCTDLFVTSDHGFSTISKGAFSAAETLDTKSESAQRVFDGTPSKRLPSGFLAMDIARNLGLPLFDPNDIVDPAQSPAHYRQIDLAAPTTATLKKDSKPFLFTQSGSGYLGGNGEVVPASKDANAPANAEVIVCANGGSDLIYLPLNHPEARRRELLEKLVDMLTKQDYVSGIFVDDRYGDVAGSLPLSAIHLKGQTTMPVPAIIVNFRTFSLDPNCPVQTEIEIADSSLVQGQGMHGSFGRGDTYNNMAAMGPSFRRGYIDPAPVSNADVAQTLAHILKLPLNDRAKGSLKGRVLEEALACHHDTLCVERGIQYSQPRNGKRTFLLFQTFKGMRYFHAGGFPGRTVVAPDWGGIVDREE